MKTLSIVPSVIAAALILSGCGVSGDARDGTRSAGGAGPSSTAGSDDPVSLTPEPGSDVHDLGGRPEPVKPRPGMADVRPVGWVKAKQIAAQRAVRVTYWSGVEPCNVLDHVDVAYSPKEITVTLYEGHDPDQADVACIEIALRKAVVVELEEPVKGRKIVDGGE